MATTATKAKVKIVSGGQTGVDQAALDAALELGLPIGGWCPRGRLTESGRLDPKYRLIETPSANYAQRTEWNVRDSDVTLIITPGRPTGGSALTLAKARLLGKPFRFIDLKRQPDFLELVGWLRGQKLNILNIAGSRESRQPGVYFEAKHMLLKVFMGLVEGIDLLRDHVSNEGP